MPDTRRKRTRVEGHFQGHIEIDGRTVAFTTENLSVKGMLCRLEEGADLDVGQPCAVLLPLGSGVVIHVEAVVARLGSPGEAQTAVDFTGMDEISYTHLRNVVRYAAEDPDAIDMEQAQPAFDSLSHDE